MRGAPAKLTKKISILEVAKLAGVGKSTVSRWQNNDPRVSEEARQKIERAVEQLKYRPNMGARLLRNRTNPLLGILISKEQGEAGITSLINSRKIGGIIKKANELNYDVLIFIEDLADTERLNNLIREKGFAGVMLLDIVPETIVKSLVDFNVPFVTVNWSSSELSGKQAFVKTDTPAAIVMALDLLASKGYAEIALIDWEDEVFQNDKMETTFREYMRKKGLPHEDAFIRTPALIPQQEVDRLLNGSRKRAYICRSYSTSMHILDYCRRNGISVPEELALISFDFFPFYEYLTPKLTGIRQKAELMGEIAVEQLIGLIAGDPVENRYIEPELVVRESI